MRLVLDTNAYSALMRGEQEIASRIRGAKQILLSAIVVGELFYGFRYGSRYDLNLAEFREFIRNPLVRLLPVSFVTAELFGHISAELRSRGALIPSNDIWIAAHAIETDSDLLSYDRHFERVQGLSWQALQT